MNIQFNSPSDKTLIDSIGIPFFNEKREPSELSFELDGALFEAEIVSDSTLTFSSTSGEFVFFTQLENGSIIVSFLG